MIGINNRLYCGAILSVSMILLQGCSSHGTSTGFGSAITSRPKGLIRIIPINPLDGSSYPVGTAFTPGSNQITFPQGVTPNVWFALELSGWGPTWRLESYGADIVVTDAYCPRPPCGCMVTHLLEPTTLACVTTTDCPEGSECSPTLHICTTAYINKSASDYVFATVSSTPSVTASFPDYTFGASLASGSVIDPGSPRMGANLILRSGDFCGTDTSVQLNFDSANPPWFKLYNGSIEFIVYPIAVGAVVYSEGP